MGDIEKISFCLNHLPLGVVNERGANACTALMTASQFGQRNAVELLLNRGAIVDLTDSGGNTALMIAAMNGRREICQLLLSAGANNTLHNSDGRTAAQCAYSKAPLLAEFISKWVS
jgi:ankyrin repeat protein